MRTEHFSRAVTLLCVLTTFCFKECIGNTEWNVDQNRLEVAHRNAELRSYDSGKNGFIGQPSRSRNTLSRYSGSQTNSDYGRRRYQRRNWFSNEPEISYSHYSPTIITAPPARNIYKSLEDPAVFYKNKVFMNSTISERMQRQPMQIPSYSMNSVNSGDQRQRNDKEETRTSDGVNIRLRGATIRVRPETVSRKSQRSSDESMENSLADSNLSHSPSKDAPCVRCPAERTAVAARGRDRAALEQPPLQACGSAEAPPLGATFHALYGPRIGDLLKEGSHITVGSIVVGNQTQQLCQYRFNVVVRHCEPLPTPSPDLKMTCPKGSLWGAACRFSCKNPQHKLKGKARLFCKDDMKWSGKMPTCQEPPEGTWCDMHPISRHGRMTCDTPSTDEKIPSSAAPEGSVCSVWCENASRLSAPKILTCRAGFWQGGTACRNNRRRRHKKMRKNSQMTDRQQRAFDMM